MVHSAMLSWFFRNRSPAIPPMGNMINSIPVLWLEAIYNADIVSLAQSHANDGAKVRLTFAFRNA